MKDDPIILGLHDNQAFQPSSESDKLWVSKSVANGDKLSLITYAFPDDAYDAILICLQSIMDHYGAQHLLHSVYNIVFELVVNAVKGNVKRLFFQEQGLTIDNSDHYEKGMLLFKEEVLQKNTLRARGQLCKEKGAYVQVNFTHQSNGMGIEVLNNAVLLPAEEKRIRARLAEGLKYANILSYYEHKGDSSEGEGLGLVLNLLLLRSEGLDTSLFRIYSYEGKTVARIEVPFNDNYQPIRQAKEFLENFDHQ